MSSDPKRCRPKQLDSKELCRLSTLSERALSCCRPSWVTPPSKTNVQLDKSCAVLLLRRLNLPLKLIQAIAIGTTGGIQVQR